MKTNVFRYSILFSLILITQNHLSAAQHPHKQRSSSSQTNKPWFKCTVQGCPFDTIEQEYLDSHITRVHNNQSINQAQISQICEPLLYITRDGHIESRPMQTQITNTNNIQSNAEVYQRAATTVLLSPTEDVALRFKCPFKGCLFGTRERRYLNSHITKVHKNKSINQAEKRTASTVLARRTYDSYPIQPSTTYLPHLQQSINKIRNTSQNSQSTEQQNNKPVVLLTQDGSEVIVQTITNSPFKKSSSTSQLVQPNTHEIQLIEYKKTQTADTMDVDEAEQIQSSEDQDELDDNMQQENDHSSEDSETLSQTEIEDVQKS